MTEQKNERYQRGLEKLEEIDSKAVETARAKLQDIAPDLARYFVEFPFGDVYSRPGLDLKTREIVAVAALAVLGNAAPQLRMHIHMALDVGCSREEILEILIETVLFAGFPAALNGMAVAKEVFVERDADEQPA